MAYKFCVHEKHGGFCERTETFCNPACPYEEIKELAPVVHGTWMHEETEGGFHIWRCSRCGRGMNNNPEGIDLYCYHCGARMDGAE